MLPGGEIAPFCRPVAAGSVLTPKPREAGPRKSRRPLARSSSCGALTQQTDSGVHDSAESGRTPDAPSCPGAREQRTRVLRPERADRWYARARGSDTRIPGTYDQPDAV